MKKIALAALLCFTGAANACPPGGFGFAFSNQVLLPQFAVQTAVIQQPLVVQQPFVVQQPVAFASAGFGVSAFAGVGGGFGFGHGFGGRGFVGGGFRGPRVNAFSRVGPFGGARAGVRIR